jgi:STELLO glycosyltransferases
MESRPMSKSIVITSIFEPTEAVVSSKMKDHRLIVVGDKKTPPGWFCNQVEYISVSEQEQMDFDLAAMLPFNHYCRKMLGYLRAIQTGADCIIDTDDDNIPKADWSFPGFENQFECITGEKGFINIYQWYSSQKIWPRGLPLNLINIHFNIAHPAILKDCKVGIWQGLADEDPDVDAVYRLTDNTPCYFNERSPLVLSKGIISPFNSQNTMIRKELFPLLYLPTYVTFRFTDILRGLVAQPIMWLYGYQLGFTNASVVQKRNPHDYMKDFESEIPMYQHGENVIEIVSNAISVADSIENNLHHSYKALLKEHIVCDKEITTLEAWLKDLKKL